MARVSSVQAAANRRMRAYPLAFGQATSFGPSTGPRQRSTKLPRFQKRRFGLTQAAISGTMLVLDRHRPLGAPDPFRRQAEGVLLCGRSTAAAVISWGDSKGFEPR
jgi:hypothetical protein